MKQKIYLRIGKGNKGHRVAASTKPNLTPLVTGTNYRAKYMPTIQVALLIDIPDKEFDTSRILLEAKIESAEPAIEIRQVKND